MLGSLHQRCLCVTSSESLQSHSAEVAGGCPCPITEGFWVAAFGSAGWGSCLQQAVDAQTQLLRGCAAPICYHGVVPARGEMPALIGQKCQGKISLDRRTHFCSKSPVFARIPPSRTVSCRSQAFFHLLLLVSLWVTSSSSSSWRLLSQTLRSQGWPQSSVCLHQHPQLNSRLCLIWLQWVISCVLRTSQECCGWLWYPILLVLCVWFLSLHDHCPIS